MIVKEKKKKRGLTLGTIARQRSVPSVHVKEQILIRGRTVGGVRQQFDKDRISRLMRVYGSMALKTDEIAAKLGVTTETIRKWFIKYPWVTENYRAGLDSTVAQVEAAVVRNAVGYSQKRKTVSKTVDASGRVVNINTTEFDEHVAGNIAAQKLFLQHRAAERWPKKGDSGDINVNIMLDGDDDEL